MQKKKHMSKKATLVLSFVIAAVMWFSVSVFINPEDSRSITNVPISMGSGISSLDAMGLSVVLNRTDGVEIEVSGSRLELSALTAADFTVTPKLSGIDKAGVYTLDLVAVSNRAEVKVLSINPKTVNITVARMETETFPLSVRMAGDVPDGYFLKEMVLADTEVTVSGPAEIIEKIDNAAVVVPEAKNGEQTLPVTFLDSRGNEIDASGLELSISSTRVNVTLYKTKTVTLSATLTGMPAGLDKNTVTLSVNPGQITLVGPEEAINGISDVYNVASISMSTVTESETREFDLIFPEGVTAVDGTSSAEVSVNVAEGMIARYIDIREFTLSAYLQGFDVTVETIRLRNVKLMGSPEIVDAIVSEDIVATVVYDVTDVPQKGRYSMQVQISSPTVTGFWVVGDYEVNVEVK